MVRAAALFRNPTFLLQGKSILAEGVVASIDVLPL
jgi:hypothetical protein